MQRCKTLNKRVYGRENGRETSNDGRMCATLLNGDYIRVIEILRWRYELSILTMTCINYLESLVTPTSYQRVHACHSRCTLYPTTKMGTYNETPKQEQDQFYKPVNTSSRYFTSY